MYNQRERFNQVVQPRLTPHSLHYSLHRFLEMLENCSRTRKGGRIVIGYQCPGLLAFLDRPIFPSKIFELGLLISRSSFLRVVGHPFYLHARLPRSRNAQQRHSRSIVMRTATIPKYKRSAGNATAARTGTMTHKRRYIFIIVTSSTSRTDSLARCFSFSRP
jgi:hypothetical protein